MTITPYTKNTLKIREALPLSDSGRTMSLLNLGSPGTGKTFLLSLLELLSLRRGFPGATFDPLGELTPALIYQLLRTAQNGKEAEAKQMWRKLRFIDVGNPKRVTCWPIYYQGAARSLWEVSSRFLRVLRLANPKLETEAPVTWPKIRRVGIMAGVVLASLGYQLTEIESLLFDTMTWQKSGLFDEAIRQHPVEAGRAVSYFREQYIPLSKAAKLDLVSPLLDHCLPFVHDPVHRRLFGGSTEGEAWQEIDEQGEHLNFDFSGITDPDTKRFAILWIWNSLDEYLKHRGRKAMPFVLTVDEFAATVQQGTAGGNPLATLIDALIQQHCRHNNIWFNCSFQSLNQIADPPLRNALLSAGNIIASRTPTMSEARILADVLFRTNPYQVKQIRRVWGREEDLRTRPARNIVIDQFNEYMHLTEQQEEYAKLLVRLPQFNFLCRLSPGEGEVSDSVVRISLADVAKGEDMAAEWDTITIARDRLAAQSGVPVATILQEIDARLPQETGAHLPPAANGQGQRRNANRAHEDSHEAQTTPSLPTLDEHQQAMLTYLVSHPDSPVTEVYKGLGIGAGQGTRLRNSLKALGLVAELELRTGSVRGGRPGRLLIPTFAAWELVGKDPPSGRGGVLHRHIQHMVVSGAKAKGYSATVEQTLDTGTIVDVALATGEGGHRIAVEIAIGSRPDREITHISNSLAAGFDFVYVIFADEHLLGRTATALQAALSAEALQKVRLLPLQQLGQVG